MCPLCSHRNLSDIDQDGKLTAEEFILAMHLIDMAMSGLPLPPVLPPEFIPPTFRCVGSVFLSLVPEDSPDRPPLELGETLFLYSVSP